MVESVVLYSFDCTHFPVLTFTAYALRKFSLICAYRKWLTCKFILLPVTVSGGFSAGGGDGALQPAARWRPSGTGCAGEQRPRGRCDVEWGALPPPRSAAPGRLSSWGEPILIAISVASFINWG